MTSSAWFFDIPPLTAMAGRRILTRTKVVLDLSGFRTNGIVRARMEISPGQEIPLSLRETPSGVLSSCQECQIKDSIACPHSAAVLLSLREQMKNSGPGALPPPNGPEAASRTPVKPSPDLLKEFSCRTLVLTGSKRSPVFVALTSRKTPMDHAAFGRLQTHLNERPGSLPPPVSRFLLAFEPCQALGKDGQPLPGFKPRGNRPESVLQYFRHPEISVYSARNRIPYRIGFLSQPPVLELTARWFNSPGRELTLDARIILDSEIRPVRNTLWMTFDQISILCGNGSLLFFFQDPPLHSSLKRLLERAEDNLPLSPGEWAPLLDPSCGDNRSSRRIEFAPPSLAPVFGDRSRWTPIVTVQGRNDGGVALFPHLSFSGRTSVPLFGPDRLRMGDYREEAPSDPGAPPFVIGRDREKELYYRNLFEKIACLSSPDESILVEKSKTGVLLDLHLPALESAGFKIDRSGLFDGTILPGPVRVFVKVSPLSEEHLFVEGCFETGAGMFPFSPLSSAPGDRTDGSPSWMIPVDGKTSLYLEGQAREHYRELSQLFDLDIKGTAEVRSFYVAMLKALRPDLPIVVAEGLSPDLSPFSSRPLPPTTFDRLASSFVPTLRPYQKEAVSFLFSLWKAGLSGILADEMGLGKTVSVLGFLRLMKMDNLFPKDTLPPLIALPASLLYNWVHEAHRFCPGIRLHIHAGSDRKDRISDFGEADFILTTYGTIRNDPHLSEGPSFSCLVLDEAHLVKNPDSRTHRALLAIPSVRRIAITGTPVENRMTDLWGIFNILMPGFLGSRLRFEQRFYRENEEGAERNDRIELLRNLLSPLILRRTKERVLSDLPPKVEVDIWIDPTREERALYSRLKARGTEDIQSSNIQAGPLRMAYLTLLLRLRQVACHPVLLPEEIRGTLTRSSKFELVLEKLAEGTAEGHKILLFSQFTTILDLFEEALPSMGISFVRLDGSTPLPERKKRVDAFQSEAPDSPSVFLASLKAGGVGLTLTRADYVFHYDPWWNPQVEAQATDRSHRIGQQKKVFIYRFLVRGTVEERVRLLKESKKEIFDLLMNAPSPGLPSEQTIGALSIGEMQELLDFDTNLDEKD